MFRHHWQVQWSLTKVGLLAGGHRIVYDISPPIQKKVEEFKSKQQDLFFTSLQFPFISDVSFTLGETLIKKSMINTG